ncbi:hypothetical protein DFH08DRAFT_798309 [Mycena albidolilacea]|uniref:Uncharacterized protein n=1 Tax=Mycena albidolilacea TaxID=1033008 RepID=A0AAD7AN17_9AGAR|nr:hypothetical protein DFH08DRAFT_798309 [Mycena albidolilacea]
MAPVLQGLLSRGYNGTPLPMPHHRRGLVNTQRRLCELEWNEAEHKRLDEEHRRRRQRRREEKAARAAGTEPERAGESQRGEGSGRTSCPALRSAHPVSRPARSHSRTGVALLAPAVPVVSPVDDTSLIQMTVKKEEDEEVNLAAVMALKNHGVEAREEGTNREGRGGEEGKRAGRNQCGNPKAHGEESRARRSCRAEEGAGGGDGSVGRIHGHVSVSARLQLGGWVLGDQ